jgi:hypothetical protein
MSPARSSRIDTVRLKEASAAEEEEIRGSKTKRKSMCTTC